MTITEQKAAQRKAGIAARRALSDTERTRSNAALCARIMALDCFKRQKTSCSTRPSAANPTSRRWLRKRPGRAKYWHGPSAARVFTDRRRAGGRTAGKWVPTASARPS